MRRSAAIAILVSLGISLSLVGGRAATAKAPSISKDEAIRQAVAFAGFSEKYIVSATQATVSDPSAQVFPIEKRFVWEVTFEKVYLSVSAPGEKAVYNPALHTVIVWVDAYTGTLVKLFTPPPKTGGITLMAGTQQHDFLSGIYYSLKVTPAPPTRPFRSILPTLNNKETGVVVQAKEIVAYYGLLTQTTETPEQQLKDRPAWIVFFGGVDQHFSSGGPMMTSGPRPPTPKATEAMIIADAIDYKTYTTMLSGGPVDKPIQEKTK